MKLTPGKKRQGAKMAYRRAVEFAWSLGMSVSDDGIAFTVCGGQLVDGRNAPPDIAAMNGWPVEEILRAKGCGCRV